MEHIQGAIGAFVETFVQLINTPKMKEMRLIQAATDSVWLRDFRTIVYNIPRQTGASFWVFGDFLKHVDESIIIVYNQGSKESLRDGYTRTGEYVPIGSHNFNREDIGLPAYVNQRIFTVDDIKGLINGNKNWLFEKGPAIKRVYLFCEGMLFSKVSKNKFYDLLAESVLDHDGLIIGTK